MYLQGPYQILWEGTHRGVRCGFSEYTEERESRQCLCPALPTPTAGLK